MNTRGIIGRKIVAIHQERCSYDGRQKGSKMTVSAIELDNGITLHTQPFVTEHDVFGDLSRTKISNRVEATTKAGQDPDESDEDDFRDGCPNT